MHSKLSRTFYFVILALTAAFWSGVLFINFNPDDYQYLHSLAPMHGWSAMFRPFTSWDANPSFFRPVANFTMVADFLLFGWNGHAFHLTNLLLHLLATALVCPFSRRCFGLKEGQSLTVMAVFGLIASHEYNLVVNTARADILVAIFTMCCLLFELRWKERKNTSDKILAVLFFLLALGSKEIGVMIMPIVFTWSIMQRRGMRHIVTDSLPYVILAVVFFYYRSFYTAPIAQSQPLMAEGSSSIIAFLRNGMYGLGYFLLPLDLETATTLLSQYRTPLVIAAMIVVVLVVVAVVTVRRSIKSSLNRNALLLSVAFSLFSGSIIFQTFERWRLYLPSIGVIVMLVVVIQALYEHAGRAAKVLVSVLLVALLSFHVLRGLSAERNWAEASRMLDGARQDLMQILQEHPARPLVVDAITLPAKIGSASILQLGQEALLQRAEADLHNPEQAMLGVADTSVTLRQFVDLYAMDRQEGFAGVSSLKHTAQEYLVAVPVTSHQVLYSAELSQSGASRRDQRFSPDDTIFVAGGVLVVQQVENGLIKSLLVHRKDTSGLPIYFNGGHFQVF